MSNQRRLGQRYFEAFKTEYADLIDMQQEIAGKIKRSVPEGAKILNVSAGYGNTEDFVRNDYTIRVEYAMKKETLPLLLNYNWANPLGFVDIYTDDTVDVFYDEKIVDLSGIKTILLPVEGENGVIIAYTFVYDYSN